MPILLVGLAAACSGGPEDNPRAAALAEAPSVEPKPCDLLSSDDVKALLGEPVGPGEQTGFECAYRRPPNEKDLRMTALQVRLEISQGTPQQLVDRFTRAMSDGVGPSYSLSTEPALGDVAAWDGDAMITAKALTPLRSAFVVVQLTGVDESGARHMARNVADRALQKVRKR